MTYNVFGGMLNLIQLQLVLLAWASGRQGSCWSLKVLECFPDFQGLESPRKQTWSLKVLEFDFLISNSVTEQVIFSVIIILQFQKMFWCFAPEFVPLHFQFASSASDLFDYF